MLQNSKVLFDGIVNQFLQAPVIRIALQESTVHKLRQTLVVILQVPSPELSIVDKGIHQIPSAYRNSVAVGQGVDSVLALVGHCAVDGNLRKLLDDLLDFDHLVEGDITRPE